MDVQDTAVVALRPQPRLFHGALKPEFARPVLAWVSANTEALTAYWNAELDALELGARLKRLPD